MPPSLNNSYVFSYVFIEKQQNKEAKTKQNKNGKKRRRKMEERKVRSRTQTRHHRLVATLPNQAD